MRRKSSKKKKIKIWVGAMISVLLSTILFLYFVGNKVWPIIVSYAKMDVENLMIEVIHQSVQKKALEGIDLEQIYITEKNNDGTITMVDFNTNMINQLLSKTNEIVQTNLSYITSGNIEKLKESNIELDETLLKNVKKKRVTQIPIGVIFANSLLSNLGPSIPVAVNFVGNVESNINYQMKSYGINNVMMETSIHISVTLNLILPLPPQQQVKVTLDVPLSVKMIQGKVPEYYHNGYQQQSPLSILPLE